MSSEGGKCLIHSIKEWTNTYKETFDKVVCFNGECPEEFLSELASMDVKCVDQTDYADSLSYSPYDTFWKFCPPRMRLNAHEIIVDNDLVIYKKLPDIEDFLNSNHVMVSAAHKHFYGQFDDILESGINVNTGLIGLPPCFDIERKLNMVFNLYPFLSLNNHCDDQGAFLCATKGRLKIIPMDHIYVCNPQANFAPYKLGIYGTHFAGLNQEFVEYWERYKNKS
jgi:hypothetical protein